ncbi:hypothetical protein C8R48DRAFT_108451 [Suillus tomentosus]|nr:hypothetical protein C8R48DRAFT_108451 [Suillus tomentosus]
MTTTCQHSHGIHGRFILVFKSGTGMPLVIWRSLKSNLRRDNSYSSPLLFRMFDCWVTIAHNHKWTWTSISSLAKPNSTASEILIERVTDCILCKGKCIYRQNTLHELTFNTLSYIALVALSRGLTVGRAVPAPFEVGLFSSRSTLRPCLVWSPYPFIH